MSTETANTLSSRRQELAALDSRVSSLEKKIIPSLYEDKVGGILPDNVFSGLLDKYEKERLDKSEKAEILRKKIAADEQTNSDASAWIRLMKKYANVDTLSAAVLLDLIEHGVVKGNTTVCLFNIVNAFTSETAKFIFGNFQAGCEDVHHHRNLHGQLEQQPRYPIFR